jgi:hypothetical protein
MPREHGPQTLKRGDADMKVKSTVKAGAGLRIDDNG